jgi:hypothetical protein
VETPTKPTVPSRASGRSEIVRATSSVSCTVSGRISPRLSPGKSATTTRYPALANPSASRRTSGSFRPSVTTPLTKKIAGHYPCPGGLTTSAGFPAMMVSVKHGSPVTASTAGVRTGASRTGESATTVRTWASIQDHFATTRAAVRTNANSKRRLNFFLDFPVA